MKIFLFSPNQNSYETGTWEKKHLEYLSRQDLHHKHVLTDNIQNADVILIVDIFFDIFFYRVLTHPILLKNLNKCYIYSEKAIVSRILPGLFTSMPIRWFDLNRFGSAMYSSHNLSITNHAIYERPEIESHYLYSYMGRNSHSIRQKIIKVCQSDPRAYIENTHDYYHWNLKAKNRLISQEKYARIIAQSKFVLCPRGWSPASIRIFEVMKMGRVPVIISDKWRKPIGPEWDSFAIFIQEKDIHMISNILHQHEAMSQTMGKNAKIAFDTYFEKNQEWHTLMQNLYYLMQNQKLSEWFFVPLWPIFYIAITVHYLGYKIGTLWKHHFKLLNTN